MYSWMSEVDTIESMREGGHSSLMRWMLRGRVLVLCRRGCERGFW